MRNRRASSPGAPTSCTPSGMSSSPVKSGSVIAGKPRQVQSVQNTGSPVAWPFGATPRAAGVMMAVALLLEQFLDAPLEWRGLRQRPQDTVAVTLRPSAIRSRNCLLTLSPPCIGQLAQIMRHLDGHDRRDANSRPPYMVRQIKGETGFAEFFREVLKCLTGVRIRLVPHRRALQKPSEAKTEIFLRDSRRC